MENLADPILKSQWIMILMQAAFFIFKKEKMLSRLEEVRIPFKWTSKILEGVLFSNLQKWFLQIRDKRQLFLWCQSSKLCWIQQCLFSNSLLQPCIRIPQCFKCSNSNILCCRWSIIRIHGAWCEILIKMKTEFLQSVSCYSMSTIIRPWTLLTNN